MYLQAVANVLLQQVHLTCGGCCSILHTPQSIITAFHACNLQVFVDHSMLLHACSVDWAAASCSPTTKPLALFLRGALLLLSAAPSPSPAAGADRRRAASLMEAAVSLNYREQELDRYRPLAP